VTISRVCRAAQGGSHGASASASGWRRTSVAPSAGQALGRGTRRAKRAW
jgi:hypothetical protein